MSIVDFLNLLIIFLPSIIQWIPVFLTFEIIYQAIYFVNVFKNSSTC